MTSGKGGRHVPGKPRRARPGRRLLLRGRVGALSEIRDPSVIPFLASPWPGCGRACSAASNFLSLVCPVARAQDGGSSLVCPVARAQDGGSSLSGARYSGAFWPLDHSWLSDASRAAGCSWLLSAPRPGCFWYCPLSSAFWPDCSWHSRAPRPGYALASRLEAREPWLLWLGFSLLH